MTRRERLYQIIFEADTPAGKKFDVRLLWAILFSIFVVILDSVPYLNNQYKSIFIFLEWIFTILFTLEYIIRIYSSPKPSRYIFSIWGLIDLLSILPTYLSLFVYGYHYLLIVRIFRLLRVFRIFKMVRFNKEASSLMKALNSSAYKISIFFSFLITIVVLLGTIMYVVEDGNNGYTSIPQSIYWAIITITTVGYGDVVPHTALGKLISSFAMLIGYAIIAVPTGIITAEFSKNTNELKKCSNCKKTISQHANYCSCCGKKVEKK